LIIEDDVLVGATLKRAFRALGCTARLLNDPRQLEGELEAHPPALIVSDLTMPGLSGIDVLSSAKRQLQASVRCLLSGSLEALTAEDVSRIEPCVLLAKPFRLDELEALIRMATALHLEVRSASAS
jgi:two-component system response regulator PrrA